MHDCVIVGGGVIGLSLAYELAGRGVSLRVLERGEPGREASWAGAGILPPGLREAGEQPAARLAAWSFHLHRGLAADLRESTGIDNGYRRSGGVYLYRGETASDRCAAELDLWRRQDVAADMLAPADLDDVQPGLAPTDVRAALFLPDESQIRNPRHLAALVAACVHRGVEIMSGVEVEDFDVRGANVEAVRTSAGRMPAGQFCISGGAWSAALCRRLGRSIGVEPIRGQIALLRCSPQPHRRIINEGLRYIVPRPDGRILIGSTEERAGYDRRTTAEAIYELLQFAGDLVPALRGAHVDRCWAGLRPGSMDGLPYMGRLDSLENAFVAAGHHRHGLFLSTGTARVMSQLMCDESPDVAMDAFRMDRS